MPPTGALLWLIQEVTNYQSLKPWPGHSETTEMWIFGDFS